jgi:catechol 2,3-dioxygenase-like lactoylglutathione lyase family enzyme
MRRSKQNFTGILELNLETILKAKDYDHRETFESHHYAFQVSDEEFDAIFARIKQAGLEYSSDPMHQNIGEINHRKGGRGVYFYNPNGHNLELLTRDS